MRPLAPWPVEAYRPYQKILKCLEHVTNITNVCLDDVRRYKDVLLVSAPLLEEWAMEMSKYASSIAMLGEDRGRGQPPKWLQVVKQIDELALDIAYLVDEHLKPALKRNDLEPIETTLKVIKREKIIIVWKLLTSLPAPTGLEVWEETVQQAVKKLER